MKQAHEPVRGVGRPPTPEDEHIGQTVFQFRLTHEQKEKLERIGGSAFLRACIDAAQEVPTL